MGITNVNRMTESENIEPSLDPNIIRTETDLLAAAIHIDRYMLNAMERLDEDYSEIDLLTLQAFRQLSSNKYALNDQFLSGGESPGDELTENLEAITLYNEQLELKVNTPRLRLQRLCSSCDRSYLYYNAIAETTENEAILTAAHRLAAIARERIEVLRRVLGKECGCE